MPSDSDNEIIPIKRHDSSQRKIINPRTQLRYTFSFNHNYPVYQHNVYRNYYPPFHFCYQNYYNYPKPTKNLSRSRVFQCHPTPVARGLLQKIFESLIFLFVSTDLEEEIHEIRKKRFRKSIFHVRTRDSL